MAFKYVDTVIIGCGTAALSAALEVHRKTENFVIITNGIYGTTCVLAGCMPAKTLIHAANHHYLINNQKIPGTSRGKKIEPDIPQILNHVRKLRKHFLFYSINSTIKYKRFIREGQAYFISPTKIKVNDDIFITRKTIIATGSSPYIPKELQNFQDSIITSDNLFELENLPSSIAVIGNSILGTEMAQCFSRLGIKVALFGENELIGAITDPTINRYAIKTLSKEFPLKFTTPQIREISGKIFIEGEEVEKIFVAQSRQANLKNMGLENIELKKMGIIDESFSITNFNPNTMQVADLPIFIAGDVKAGRSILHEAVEEGKIAGRNAVSDKIESYPRTTNMQICYTSPILAIAGASYEELKSCDIITGVSKFDNQGRARIMNDNKGLIHIYADKISGQLLGGEIFAPQGESLAHMISWLVDLKVTITQALELPYYHPTLEEALKTAFEDLASQKSDLS